MADTHQPFRLPQQSKRENPRLILQNNNPQLSSTFQHTPVHQLHCPDQNPNPAGFVNNEGVHVVGPSSSSFSFPSCGDHSLYSIQNVKDLDHRFSFGADAVSLSLAPHHRHERCAPLELNPKRYDVVSVRGGTPKPNNELRSSVPLGPFTGYASILKRSSFLSPAQQLLEDFCGVGRRVSDSASFDPPVEGSGTAEDPIGCSHGSEHCWKSSRLAPMLDEVYRRYKLYCQQMHSIVASFETVAGLQNAAPYISFAFKAMSKHFRYLKNAILDQIQFTGKTLIGHNIGKDETPRVWTADQGFHSQKAVQNSIFLQHPVWRSQRGLPDQAVAVLRAWLFEHFLHPYPTDLEKQILAQQTSLSRNQVSNWFINARVRLWKPMVEEILMLETKQAQIAAEGEANKPTDRLPSANPIPLGKPFQNTPTQKMEDAQSKRSRNKLYYMFEQRDEQTNLPYNNFSSNCQMGVSGIEKSTSKGISLALGLHQNKGIESSRSFSVNMSHHFGLETNSQQYLRNGSEARNQNSGKDLRAHLLHDFASRSIPFNSNA